MQLRYKEYKNRNIYILSDSQAVVKALDSSWIWECHQSLMVMSEYNTVQLAWMLGNRSIERNEMWLITKERNWTSTCRTKPSLQYLKESFSGSSGTGCTKNSTNSSNHILTSMGFLQKPSASRTRNRTTAEQLPSEISGTTNNRTHYSN
jgi:hypothetical protein